MSKLVLHLEDGTTVDIPLDQERITIGRRADNEVCLPNLAVSGEHAAVVTILDDSFLEDLGSTNGTLVNGNAIVKHFLRDGDEIDVGRHKFIYCVDEGAVVTSMYVARGMAAPVGDMGDQVPVAKAATRSRRAGESERSKAGAAPREAAGAGKKRGPKSVRGREPSEAVERAPPVPTPAPIALAPSPPDPSVKVLVGPQAGREIPLTGAQTTIGGAGVQVALITRSSEAFHLKPIEGERFPLVNGRQVTGDGVDLVPGDMIEIAGSKLEFAYRT